MTKPRNAADRKERAAGRRKTLSLWLGDAGLGRLINTVATPSLVRLVRLGSGALDIQFLQPDGVTTVVTIPARRRTR